MILQRIQYSIKAGGLNFAQLEFGISVRCQLILNPNTKENYLICDKLYPYTRLKKYLIYK